MSKKTKYQEERDNPFDNQPSDDIRAVDDAIYSKVDWDGGNRIVAKSLPIMQIEADVTQPRRIVPREVRGAWDGSPEGVPDLLDEWHDAVMDYVDDLPLEKILNGKMPPFGNEKNPYGATGAIVVDEFLRLLDLAAQIKDVGLQQPIGVITLPHNRHRIIFGERRWMAFHVLAHFVDDKWNQIPAKVADISAFDVAKIQAAENMQRVELNAIERARQFAKLIIEARRDNPETPYDSWNALVVPGGCDRPYWAQVHDGNVHPIPYGMGPIFEQTLGISTGQMRNYRALLQMFDDWDVDNELWEMGDEFNWSENLLREIREMIDLDTVRTILKESPEPEETLREVIANEKEARRRMKAKARTVTTVTVLDENEPEETPKTLPPLIDKSTWEAYKWIGLEAWAGSQKVFVVDATKPQTVVVRYEKNGEVVEGEIHISALFDHAPGDEPANDNADTPKPDAISTYRDKKGVAIVLGATVITRRGIEAVVTGFNGRYVEVESSNPYLTKGHYAETLEVVTSAPKSSAAVDIPAGSEKSAYPTATQLVGRPMMYQGQPCIVVGNFGSEEALIQLGKERLQVHVSLLSESEATGTVKDYIAEKSAPAVSVGDMVLTDDGRGVGVIDRIDGNVARVTVPTGTWSYGLVRLTKVKDKPAEKVEEAELVLAASDEIRPLLGQFQAWAAALENDDAKEAIADLLLLRRGEMPDEHIHFLVDEVNVYIDDLCGWITAIISERLKVLKEEVENGVT